MSEAFWKPYSIKGQNPDSLVKKLRAGRVDVSKMSPTELEAHLSNEAQLRQQIATARGLPKILPEPEVEPPATPTAPADATRVRKPRGY